MANEEDTPRGQKPVEPLSAAEIDAAVASAREAHWRRDPADLLSERLSGKYIWSYTHKEPGFTARDAIALGLLAGETTDGRESWLKEFYLSAFRSVVCALHLNESEKMLVLLAPGLSSWEKRNALPRLQHPLDLVAFKHLLKARHAVLRFRNVRHGYIEGDPWGDFQQATDRFGRTNHQSLRAAVAWFDSTCVQATRGIPSIDEAICALVCWDTSVEVSFALLRQDFGYPDPGPVCTEYMESL